MPSMMRELAAEWVLASPPLLARGRVGSPVGAGLGPLSATAAEGAEGMLCGWYDWNC